MASTIKVDNVQNQPGNNLINRCSATTTVGSGAGNTVVVCGSTVTIGRCSGTVALATGATQTGFGRTGTVDWITTAKVTGDSPVTVTVLPDAPTFIAVPHLLMMFESSETLFILSTLILLVIILFLSPSYTSCVNSCFFCPCTLI